MKRLAVSGWRLVRKARDYSDGRAQGQRRERSQRNPPASAPPIAPYRCASTTTGMSPESGSAPCHCSQASLPTRTAVRASARGLDSCRHQPIAPAASAPCRTPDRPTYHCSCGSKNTNPRSMASDAASQDQQPAAQGVFARKQRRDQAQTDCIQQQVLAGAVHQVAGEQPPVLALQDRRPLVAQELAPGFAGRATAEPAPRPAVQRARLPGSTTRLSGRRIRPGTASLMRFGLLCYDPAPLPKSPGRRPNGTFHRLAHRYRAPRNGNDYDRYEQLRVAPARRPAAPRIHADRDHGRGRDPGHPRRAGRAERHAPHRRCADHQGQAGHARVRDRAQPVQDGQLQVPDHRPGPAGAGPAAERPDRAQLEARRLPRQRRPDQGSLAERLQVRLSRRSTASTTSTRSAPTTRKAAKASTPTGATGRRSDLAHPRRAPAASRCSRSWSSS